MTEVRFAGGEKDLSLSLRVRTGPEAHPDVYPMVTAGPFCGGTATGGLSWPLTSNWCQRSYTSTTPYVLMAS